MSIARRKLITKEASHEIRPGTIAVGTRGEHEDVGGLGEGLTERELAARAWERFELRLRQVGLLDQAL